MQSTMDKRTIQFSLYKKVLKVSKTTPINLWFAFKVERERNVLSALQHQMLHILWQLLESLL